MRRTEEVMGTVFSFTVHPGELTNADTYLALAAARATLHRADAVFSTWKADSPVSRLRRAEIALADCPEEVAEVLELCRRGVEMTGGWFDPWSLPGGVDPTGLVKGWAVDAAMAVLIEAGVQSALIDGGGDIAVHGLRPGNHPWKVGIRDPWFPDHTIATVVAAAAVATSGTYERGEHVINPFTGAAQAAAVSATVTGPDLALADALATGLLAGGRPVVDLIARLPGWEAFLVTRDREAIVTEGFPFEPVPATTAPEPDRTPTL